MDKARLEELLSHIEQLEDNVSRLRKTPKRAASPKYYGNHAAAGAWEIEVVWLRGFLRRCQESAADEFLAMSERLTAAETLLAECQAQATELTKADGLTAAEYDDLIYLCRQAEQINNTPSVRQRYHRLAEKLIGRQGSAGRLTADDLRTLASCAEATAAMLDGPNDGTAGLMELAREVRRMADNRSAADATGAILTDNAMT